MNLPADRFLAEALSEAGVTHYFHVPVSIPGALKHMPESGITPVMAHGEKAAAYMADGYARVCGRVGVCGSQTIGGTNLAAGLRDAYLARVPVLAITGGKLPESEYRGQYQEIDDMPVYQVLTKYNAIVWSPDRLPDLLSSAFRAATTGTPQPVHLEFSGIGGERAITGEVDADPVHLRDAARFPRSRPPADPEQIARAVDAFRSSRRPVVVAGGGARFSQAGAELARLVELLDAPFALSLNARGIVDEDSARYLGVPGEYSAESANIAISEADLVVFVGSQAGGLVTRTWSVPPRGASVVHIDIDPNVVGRNYLSAIGVVGDARTVLRQILDVLPQAAPRPQWRDRVAELRSEWTSRVSGAESSTQTPILPQHLVRELSRVLPDDAILVGDTGHAGAWVAQNARLSSPGQTLIRAHGSLGWSFPAALGAKAAAPERPVVCFSGDGGFYYHLGELETAVRYGLDVVVVVNNNSAYNQERGLWGDDPRHDKNWKLETADFARVAEGFGCAGRRIDAADEIAPSIEWALRQGRPVVLDVRTDIGAVSVPSWSVAGLGGMYTDLEGRDS